jgi:DNA-binding winged helix-turn-helix (wHTH) protein/TolB-like protein/Tfp pilus assembly protein PilF
MAVSDGTIYEFADFRLIPKDNLLLRDGEPVSLPPKAFSTLVLLVENQGHLVRKEELIETFWADAFVDEAAVSRCIWTIRNALREDSKSQRYIQTVPKHGYKFVADVSEFGESTGVNTLSNGNGLPASARDLSVGSAEASYKSKAADQRRKLFELGPWKRFGVVAAILFAVGTSLIYLWVSRPRTAESGTTSIAVLPFHPIDASNRDELYDVGIADALINRLSTLENLQVRSLSSVRRYVDLEADALAAGAEQKVDYVLASRYQLDGGKIRITAQLINVGSGKIIESYVFLKEVSDAFAAQDAVAFEFNERLASKFGNNEVGVAYARGTSNEQAFRYYLLAQNFNELRGTENGRIALEQIDQAIALDPNFARAWATKAYIHRYLAYGSVGIEHSLKSIDAVEKALAIDPILSEAHSSRCFNKFRFEYDFEAAERSCKRAIELDPNSPLAHKIYSNFLYTRGRFDESLAEIKKAIDLQPVSYDNQQTYALALYFARKYPEAETQWKQLIPLNPNHHSIYRHLVSSLVRQGKEPEALEYLIKLLTLENESEETIRQIRAQYSNSGWRDVNCEQIRIAESSGSARPYDLARLYAAVNDKDNAFKYLELAYKERSNMMAVLEVDPEFDALRGDPRYLELLNKLTARGLT